MKGTYHLTVQSVHLKYEMEFSRNLTILQGESATGKTTLVDMIQEYILNGSDTGIQMSCDCPCAVVSGNTWMTQLQSIENSIVFIDEGNRFVASSDFARAVQRSSNYYVIVTREGLNNLPYSVTEIYGIRSSGKFASQEPVYHQMYRIYGEELLKEDAGSGIVVVEDSNAGYEFFQGLCDPIGKEWIAAGGASRIFGCLSEMDVEEGVTVIADGAAFGSQIGRIYQLAEQRGNVRLYLPESFEWIILASDILDDAQVRGILEDPSAYIDSSGYFSWERYFTGLLVEKTKDTWRQYSKSRLNPVYLQGKACQKIVEILPEKIRELFQSE